MIPKRLFQTHEYGVPPHVEAAVRDRAPGWYYQFYSHEDIVSYFAALCEDDPDCKPLHDALCEAHDITIVKSDTEPKATTCTNGTIKLSDLLQLHDVFVYYYLFKHGGAYMDTGVMVHDTQTLSAIVEPESVSSASESESVSSASESESVSESESLVAIESCLTPVLFTGFMACTPGHPVLRKAIQHINAYVADFRQCCRDGTKFDVAQMKVGAVMHAACKEALENANANANACACSVKPLPPTNPGPPFTTAKARTPCCFSTISLTKLCLCLGLNHCPRARKTCESASAPRFRPTCSTTASTKTRCISTTC
jgi:hypothetical protein